MESETGTPPQPATSALLWKWVLGTLAGTIVGVALMGAVIQFVPGLWGMSATERGAIESVLSLMLPLLAGAALGFGSSLIQGTILQHRLPEILSGVWLGMTMVGFALSVMAISQLAGWMEDPEMWTMFFGESALFGKTALYMLGGFVLGLPPALGQWFLLRKALKRSSLWIIATSVAWSIAVLVASQLYPLLTDAIISRNEFGTAENQLEFVVVGLIEVVVVGLIVGLVTGLALKAVIRTTPDTLRT